jgi:Primase X
VASYYGHCGHFICPVDETTYYGPFLVSSLLYGAGGYHKFWFLAEWIEKLLQTPIDDYRKNAVSLILVPYLINIRKLSYDDALNAISSNQEVEKSKKSDYL